jgi:hypothetical protein
VWRWGFSTKFGRAHKKKEGGGGGVIFNFNFSCMNVLVDYTNSRTIIEAVGDKSKYKRKGTDLEILMGCKHQQVVPPSTTTCKISGKAEHARKFLNSKPVLELIEGSSEMKFILDLLTEPPAAVAAPRRAKVKVKTASVPQRRAAAAADAANSAVSSPAKAEEETEDKYIDLLFNVIENDIDKINYDKWFKIGTVLKCNQYPIEVFERYSIHSTSVEVAQKWAGISSKSMSIHTLQNLANDVNPEGYKEWLGKPRPSKARLAETDCEAADIIMKDLCGDILTDGTGRIWMKRENVWHSDLVVIQEMLKYMVLNSQIRKPNGTEGKTKPYAANVSSCNAITEAILLKIKAEAVDVRLYDKFHSTTKGRLAFNDGVLDMATKRFWAWDEIDFPYFTTLKIGYDMGDYFTRAMAVDAEVNADKKAVMSHVFEVLFNTKVDIAMHYFARVFGGHCEDKNWAAYMGNRDCGKGVLYDMLEKGIWRRLTLCISCMNVNPLLWNVRE